jgi:hypothetical protein
MQSQPAAISVSDLSDSAKRHTLRNARPQTEKLRFVFDDKRQKYFRKKHLRSILSIIPGPAL